MNEDFNDPTEEEIDRRVAELQSRGMTDAEERVARDAERSAQREGRDEAD